MIIDDSSAAGGSRRRALPGAVRLTALIVPLLLLILAYYLWVWGSVSRFVAAVDHTNQLFPDFLKHYYPMGQSVLDTATPVPGYFYSAFSALLLVSFGLLQPDSALWAWGTLQVVSLVILCVLPLFRLLRLSPPGIALYVGVFVTSFPLLHNLKWGQVSVLLTLFIVAAFHFHAGRMRVLAGVLLAAAAAIKYYPAAFLVYFIIKRDIRVCASFALALIALYVIFPAAVLGPQPWMAFERAVFANISDAGVADWLGRAMNSQYAAHVAGRWLDLGPAGVQALTLAGYAVLLFNVALLWLIQRREVRDRHTLSLVLLFLSLPFVIRTSWPHYFSYLPFCQCAVVSCLTSGRSAPVRWSRVLLLLPLSSIACSSVFVFNAFPDWKVYSGCGMPFLANLLLLACVYIVTLRSGSPSGQAGGQTPSRTV